MLLLSYIILITRITVLVLVWFFFLRHSDGSNMACLFAGRSQCDRQPLGCLPEPLGSRGETSRPGSTEQTAGQKNFKMRL